MRVILGNTVVVLMMLLGASVALNIAYIQKPVETQCTQAVLQFLTEGVRK